jgi:2-keto-myo-inositol isomerase
MRERKLKTCFNEGTTLKNSSLGVDLVSAERVGFDYIEIWLCQLDTYLQTHKLKGLRDYFNSSRIKPFALDSFEDVNFRDAKNAAKLDGKFEKACEYGADLGCPRIVTVPTVQKGLMQKHTKEDATKDSVEVLHRLADIAQPYNVKVAFEPIGFADCAVRSIGHAWEIVQEVNRDNVGLTLDVFNTYLYDALRDIDDIKKIDVNKIFIFHIDDAPVMPLERYKLDHSDRCLPGRGGLPYGKFIEILDTMGYKDAASLELFNPELYQMNPYDAIKMGYEAVKAALDKC